MPGLTPDRRPRDPGCPGPGDAKPRAADRGAAPPALLHPPHPLHPPSPHRPDALGLGVPGYAHPLFAPGEWAELGRPGTPLHWVVINVSLGPGVRPDPLFLDATAQLRAAGVRLLAYLDVARPPRHGDLLSEADRHLERYRVDGYFLDRVPTERDDLPECRRNVRALRRRLGVPGHVVLGHATHPDPGYAEVGDQILTFSGPWAHYRWLQIPEWTADHPPEKFCHLVHSVPDRHLQEALRLVRWQGAATIYLTDRTGPAPWEGLPSYWARVVRLVRAQPPPCR